MGEQKKRPTVVCLCGSSRFMEAYEAANKRETLAGRIVLSIGMFSRLDGLDMDGPVKAMLDELHLAKIEMADEVLVLDAPRPWCFGCGAFTVLCSCCLPPRLACCRAANYECRPYVGDDTRREIAYAEGLGKRIRYLSREGTPS